MSDDTQGDRQVAVNPTPAFARFLETFKPQLEKALPRHLNSDRMSRLALTAFSQSQQLQQCEARTIVSSLMVAGQMGLEPGVNGQGYLVPYKRTCTFVPGWQGIVDIVNRSGRATVWTGAVFQGDDFDYAQGDSPFVKHRTAGEDNPDKLQFVYAIGRVNNAQWPVVEVWPIERVRRHFNRFNKVGEKHYAYQHWEMYARKIPLLQVCKYMPKSIELNNALVASHAADEGRGVILEGNNYVTVADLVDGDEAGDTGAPPPMPTRKGAPPAPAASTPPPPPPAAAKKTASAPPPPPAAPAAAPAPAEDTGEAISPALVNILKSKCRALDLTEDTINHLLKKFGADDFQKLSLQQGQAMKAELVEQGA